MIFNFFHIDSMEITSTQKFEHEALFINYTENKMTFAFGLMFDNYTRYTHDDYFSLTLSFVTIDKLKNTKVKETIPVKNCKRSDFFNMSENDFDALDLNIMMCPQPSKLMVTQGGEAELIWSYLEFSVKLKTTDNIPEIREWLRQYPTKIALYHGCLLYTSDAADE